MRLIALLLHVNVSYDWSNPGNKKKRRVKEDFLMQIWDLFDLYNQPNIEHSNKVVTTYHRLSQHTIKKLLFLFNIPSQTIGLVLVSIC
jgi:hypothetical protein